VVDQIITVIQQFGYGYFFLLIIIGANFTPIPDPLFIMLAGNHATLSTFHPFVAFLLTYSAMMLSLYVKFLFARWFRKQTIKSLSQSRFQKKRYEIENLIASYGSFGIMLSFFLPGMRHVMPLFLGTTKMPHLNYITTTFSFGLIWTFAFFLWGFKVDDAASFETISQFTILFIAISIGSLAYQKRKMRSKE